jgi:hypothetical protein
MGNPLLKNVKDYRRTMTLGCVSFRRFFNSIGFSFFIDRLI